MDERIPRGMALERLRNKGVDTDMQNPMSGDAEAGTEFFIPANQLPEDLKEGDEVHIIAKAGKIGSRVGLSLVNACKENAEDEADEESEYGSDEEEGENSEGEQM